MKTQRAFRVKERVKRKTVKGKKVRLQYRFQVNEFVSYNNEFVLLGEAFYPVYKSVDRNYMGGGLAPGPSTVFDGYKYTHAVIIGFDHTGKLVWDNSFEINDVRSFNLSQFVKMNLRPNKIVLLYLYEDRIRSKVILDDQILEPKGYTALRIASELADEEESFSTLDYWYDGYFTASGTKNLSSRWLENKAARYSM